MPCHLFVRIDYATVQIASAYKKEIETQDKTLIQQQFEWQWRTGFPMNFIFFKKEILRLANVSVIESYPELRAFPSVVTKNLPNRVIYCDFYLRHFAWCMSPHLTCIYVNPDTQLEYNSCIRTWSHGLCRIFKIVLELLCRQMFPGYFEIPDF